MKIRLYSIDYDFMPYENIKLKDYEWLYLVNYYGQFDNAYYNQMVIDYNRVIFDQTHAYFNYAVQGADCIYTCRKFFGVADGAFVYTGARLNAEIPVDESFDIMRFVLGRYERNASEFFEEACNNNLNFENQPIKKLSRLTMNLLHGIDYDLVKKAN